MTSDISGSRIQDRKRTLILRGMVGVEQEKVRQVLKSYGIGVEGLVRVAPRRIKGTVWGFLEFSSPELARKCSENKQKLKGSRYYLWKDLNLRERMALQQKRIVSRIGQNQRAWQPKVSSLLKDRISQSGVKAMP